MTTLLKWDRTQLPMDFYKTKTHMWILLDGKIRKRAVKHLPLHVIHAKIWGGRVWDIDERGYYNENYGIIQAHINIQPTTAKMLAKKFPNAMYITTWQD